jgi:hypothetical protein
VKLAEEGLYEVKVIGDGNCLFRALIDQLKVRPPALSNLLLLLLLLPPLIMSAGDTLTTP